jgi:hypothetical protein
VQLALALALAASLLPLSLALAQDDDQSSRPTQLLSAQAQQGPAGGPVVQPVGPPPPPFVYGFFRDPLWPGPGQRFLAAECAIGVGATIVHYCPGRPPAAEPLEPPTPVMSPVLLNCDPWFQYFPTCRRPFQE